MFQFKANGGFGQMFVKARLNEAAGKIPKKPSKPKGSENVEVIDRTINNYWCGFSKMTVSGKEQYIPWVYFPNYSDQSHKWQRYVVKGASNSYLEVLAKLDELTKKFYAEGEEKSPFV